MERAVGLELRDVARQSRLLMHAQATAEVEEQPLDLEFGQFKGRPNVEADGYGSKAGCEVESRQTLAEWDGLASHSEGETTHVVVAGDDGQER